MLKSKSLATLALAGMMTVGGAMAGAAPVHAAAPSNGTTPVVYDNRNIIPDGNGQYGMIIPTAISFTDDNKTADASVEITGINGYNLDTDWTALDVTASVKSANSYTLTGPGDPVAYTVKMANNGSVFSGAAEQEITKHFGVGGETVKKEAGTATLTGKATVKGQYTDTLTYSFVENTNTLK